MDTPALVDETTIEEIEPQWPVELEDDHEEGAAQPFESPLSQIQTEDERSLHMLPVEEIEELKSRWQILQLKFVDEPEQSVDSANELIFNLLGRLAQVHTERGNILKDRNSNGDINTEDLRVAFQQYRACFESLIEI